MIPASTHDPYVAGRPYTKAKLVAVILALVVLCVLCVLCGMGGAWVANLRVTSTPQPSPTETVDPTPMGTIVPL